MEHGFIGFGNLAKAIYGGLKNNPENSFSYISKSNKHEEIDSVSSLKELISFSDVVWLCVKPQVLAEVLEDMKGINLKEKVVVSVIAGKSIGFIEGYLGKDVTIIRTMPNLAIAYQKSVTALCVNKDSSQVPFVKHDLEKLGKVIELPEQHFDLFTGIFGSGPAFLLKVFSVFKNQMRDLDISDSISDTLLLELLSGTTTYFKESYHEKSIEDLISNVTSKGGTTEAGLKYFKDNHLDSLLGNVIQKAKKRSEEMGE